MDERIKKICEEICEELINDNGGIVVNDEYDRCVCCGKERDHWLDIPKINHLDTCIVTLAKQVLDSKTNNA